MGARPATEGELADLGVFRIPVPVPFPQAGGPANVYLIEEPDGRLLLFDTGIGTPEGERALEEGFQRAGKRFSQVSRIVISHGHVDHFGAARTILEWHGGEVPVFAHRQDIPKIAAGGRAFQEKLPFYAAHFRRLGVPDEVMATSAREIARNYGMARPLDQVWPIEPGERLRTRWGSLEVHHMPGHTPGVICLHDRENGLFFSDDHLLEKVSPNPLIELGPNGEEGAFRPLVAYRESLGRLRALEVGLVLPGHAEPFTGHAAIIDGLLRFFEKRQARIEETLAAGPLSAYDLAGRLFPKAGPREVFLTLSETVANLEVLEENGRVVRQPEQGRYLFQLAR